MPCATTWPTTAPGCPPAATLPTRTPRAAAWAWSRRWPRHGAWTSARAARACGSSCPAPTAPTDELKRPGRLLETVATGHVADLGGHQAAVAGEWVEVPGRGHSAKPRWARPRGYGDWGDGHRTMGSRAPDHQRRGEEHGSARCRSAAARGTSATSAPLLGRLAARDDRRPGSRSVTRGGIDEPDRDLVGQPV